MSYSSKISGITYVIHNENDCIQNILFHGKQWNEEIVTVLKEYISKKKLTHFLNIGAHIGTVCLPISLCIQKVTAFEAYPTTYNHLCENIRLNRITNIDTFNIAVGNSEEDIYFMSNEKVCPIENINRVMNNSGGMHVFTEHDIVCQIRSSHLTDKKIKNRMNKLDNLNIDKFDIMLVDIEGSEYEFLLGAEQSIRQHKPILIIELWSNHKRRIENMVKTQEEVIRYIESLQYRVVKNIGDDFIFEPLSI